MEDTKDYKKMFNDLLFVKTNDKYSTYEHVAHEYLTMKIIELEQKLELKNMELERTYEIMTDIIEQEHINEDIYIERHKQKYPGRYQDSS